MDQELTHTVDLALGGAIVDIGDTAVDALLSGLGGIGIYSTLRGINHACSQYGNGAVRVDALAKGVGVAVEGTARSLVGAAELAYLASQSKPSRFVGRSIKKGAVSLDNKLSGN